MNMILVLLILRCFLFLFFFHSSGDHRDLHSFPTRRSSDLWSAPWSHRSAPSSGSSWCSCTRQSPGSCQCRCSLSGRRRRDRKSTRLNSSHRCISYAVFCLKKKKKIQSRSTRQSIFLTCSFV